MRTTRSRKQPPTVDKAWFESQLANNRKSMRELATFMGLDVGAVSRTFSGGRKMKLEEATAIAQFLNAPLGEVLNHAGVAVDAKGAPSRITLAAQINAKGEVNRLKDPRPLPQNVIERAQAACRFHGMSPTAEIVAAQIRAPEGSLAVFDDAVVLFLASSGVDPSAIGALSICRSYDGDQIMAKIERARKTGEARVICTDGKAREFLLQTASPIIAIIP